MFERMTDSARQTIVLAQEHARRLRHNYIGTEHLLLALADNNASAVAGCLADRGATVAAVTTRIEAMVGHGAKGPSGHIPFTPRAKKCLELAVTAAIKQNRESVTPGYLLIGILDEGEGVAAQALVDLRVDLAELRSEAQRLANDEQTPAQPE